MLNYSSYMFTLTVTNFLQDGLLLSNSTKYAQFSVDVVVSDAALASTPFVYFGG
jgi:hypothetical protein